jgi:hypothetical protein
MAKIAEVVQVLLTRQGHCTLTVAQARQGYLHPRRPNVWN